MGNRSRSTTSAARDLPGRVAALVNALASTWPDAVVELDHRNAFELLCATILAAQSTDKGINKLSPALFARYPDARALAAADPAQLEPLIFASGFYRAKGRSLLGMARALVERHGGEVPRTLAELVELPGVARKTGNVVLQNALDITVGFVVDTHVTRLSARLGLTRETDPVKIERDLMAVVPQSEWKTFANRLIWHGRRVCHAKKPACEQCSLAPHCPSVELASATAADATAKPQTARPKVVAKKPPAKQPPATQKPKVVARKPPAPAKKPAAKRSK